MEMYALSGQNLPLTDRLYGQQNQVVSLGLHHFAGVQAHGSGANGFKVVGHLVIFHLKILG
jgi:hypothetical protein